MRSGYTRTTRAVHLAFFLCLGVAGCRFMGCGAPSGDEAEGPNSEPRSGRITAKTAAPHGVIDAPQAPEIDELDTDAENDFSFDADADPQSGGAPLDVSFSVTLENPPPGLTIEWDFGDHSPPSTIKNPAHIYREPGEYTAIVKATAPGIEETREFNIEVTEEAFDVDIEADPDIGHAPLTSKFTAVVPDEIEPEITCEWAFGDGSHGRGKTTTHTYNQPGQYTAKLTVTHTNGQVGTKEVEIQVDEPDETDNEPTD